MAQGLSETDILSQAAGLAKEDLLACTAYAADLAPGSRARTRSEGS
jgi:uncharacterized protein (DUF433 family)